jgi:hypothetical protein
MGFLYDASTHRILVEGTDFTRDDTYIGYNGNQTTVQLVGYDKLYIRLLNFYLKDNGTINKWYYYINFCSAELQLYASSYPIWTEINNTAVEMIGIAHITSTSDGIEHIRIRLNKKNVNAITCFTVPI